MTQNQIVNQLRAIKSCPRGQTSTMEILTPSKIVQRAVGHSASQTILPQHILVGSAHHFSRVMSAEHAGARPLTLAGRPLMMYILEKFAEVLHQIVISSVEVYTITYLRVTQ